MPPFSKSEQVWLASEYNSRARAIRAVDDMVRVVVDSLTPQQLDNTRIFLTSDNGYQLGGHRLRAKKDPYNSTTSVPLLVRGPQTVASEAGHLLAHIDLCPTILELAGATIPGSVQARSFVPLLQHSTAVKEEDWQTEIMIENWSQKNAGGEYTDFVYTGLRFHHSIYINWAGGGHEYYDLRTDPDQLDNAYKSLSIEDKQRLFRRLRNFRREPVEPVTTIATRESSKIQPRAIALRGFSEDDRGVDEVLLTIESEMTGRFWTGTQWQDNSMEIMLPPRAPGQLISEWTFDGSLFVETKSGLDTIIVDVRTMDILGNAPDGKQRSTVMIDDLDPYVEYSRQLMDGMQFDSTPVALGGSVTDNLAVERVELEIIDLMSSEYFNGMSFQIEPVAVEAEINGTDWNASLDLPVGSYSRIE